MKTKLRPDILLDGSQGEGGGQILRTALGLSAVTGKPFTMVRIRAGRKRPGLMRQHLAGVKAVASLTDALIPERVGLGSTSLDFEPRDLRGGEETFLIGSAGSTTLLFQTVLPILLKAPEACRFSFVGGTHVPFAPCFEYAAEILLPTLRAMGADLSIQLERAGFFPAGGGLFEVSSSPADLSPIHWNEAAMKEELTGEILLTSGIASSVADREMKKLFSAFGLDRSQVWVRHPVGTACPGNAVLIRAASSYGSPGTLTSSYGDRGKRAERVASESIMGMKRYLESSAPVDEFLADQLLVPLALAGGGSFVATALTPHFHSQVDVISQFLPDVFIETECLDRFTWKVEITK